MYTGGKHTRNKRLIYGKNIIAGIPLIVSISLNFNTHWKTRNLNFIMV